MNRHSDCSIGEEGCNHELKLFVCTVTLLRQLAHFVARFGSILGTAFLGEPEAVS
jgi:hypothetical protein